ncbi:hypothetical protein [Streptomyces sp. NPDC049915]|uniref:hypothetical protein n=1 Tax=Streptomyces sp. NPDC049915 TaxID=3155510 RepID=UPI003416ADD0
MEQRIGESSRPLKAEALKAEPVTGAGFDPAFVPGLTSPVSDNAEKAQDAVPETAEETPEPKEVTPAEDVSEDGSGDVSGDGAGDASGEDDAPAGGPVFEAADRRARIVADHRGVRLSLDDQACEFRWDEIGAVETETARFGKRFTVTVYTPERRWYPIEIEAGSRADFATWEAELDAVLDAYFEEDTEAEAEAEAEAETGSATDGDD